jgi:hypothetical protein
MVIDFKLFTPGEPLRDGLFTVLEQIPGQVRWEDKTETLRTTSYWSSYNIAYYPDIYNISGTYDSYVEYGDFFSYTMSPRSQIFRRDHGKVKARSDLNPASGVYSQKAYGKEYLRDFY